MAMFRKVLFNNLKHLERVITLDSRFKSGFALVEFLVAIGIFVVFIAVALLNFTNQIKLGNKEINKTKTVQEGFISNLILTKELSMAGLGVPLEYNGQFIPINSSNNSGPNNSDELIIRGSVASTGIYNNLKWSYNKDPIFSTSGTSTNPLQVSVLPEDSSISYSNEVQKLFTLTFKPNRKGVNYTHPFEQNDKIIFLDSETKNLLSDKIYTITSINQNSIVFTPNPDFQAKEKNALLFCIGQNVSANSFSNFISNFTGYKLSSSSQSQCAPSTGNLVKVFGSSMPVLDCVLDFQVQFAISSSNGSLTWVNDLSSYSPTYLKDNLKGVKIYIVKQFGIRDSSYTYPDNKIDVADNSINLTSEQRHYRWRIITLSAPLRILK